MKKNHIILGAIGICIAVIASYAIYIFYFKKPEKLLFQVETVSKKSISQLIKATGFLEVKEMMKIGSLVPGVVQQMFVEENEMVKKGQLIALVDDGKGDTEVRASKAAHEQAKAAYIYQSAFYERQKALYQAKQISPNEFERNTQDYLVAKDEVARTKALYDQASLTYENKKIRAPEDGMVISQVAREGETVTLSSPPTLIYTIAKDITQMEAKLEIDENTVGLLKKGEEVRLTFDTYPTKIFHGTISAVSHAAVKENKAVSYLATVPLDNSERLFRPEMTVHAKIIVAERSNVVGIPGHVFRVNRNALQLIAKEKGYTYSPIKKKERAALKEQGGKEFVWVFQNNGFVEKAVTIGVNDNANFEVIDGVAPGEQLIVDTAEPDAMKEFFERFFGKGLSS